MNDQSVESIRQEIKSCKIWAHMVGLAISLIVLFMSATTAVAAMAAQGVDIGIAAKVAKDVVDRGDVVFGLVVLCILLAYVLYRLIDRTFKANERMTNALSSASASTVNMSKAVDQLALSVRLCQRVDMTDLRGGDRSEEDEGKRQGKVV